MTDADVSATTLTVLFVDDDPDVIRAIARLVAARTTFKILTAAGGEEALGILRAKSVDVLVSDIDMPRMSGLELVRQTRREFPTTLRILLTGAGTMDRAIKAINEGEVVRFFAKPFEVDTFIHALSDLGERILALRRERYAESQRERCDQFFQWIEKQYPGTLAFERDGGEVVIDLVRLRAYADSAPPSVRVLLGAG
jgi:two-component system, probable response regulator PhcQ